MVPITYSQDIDMDCNSGQGGDFHYVMSRLDHEQRNMTWTGIELWTDRDL